MNTKISTNNTKPNNSNTLKTNSSVVFKKSNMLDHIRESMLDISNPKRLSHQDLDTVMGW